MTDYLTKYNITQAALDKINEKFKKEGEFIIPTLDVEKEFVIDLIISQLVKVKNEKWGNPVKLD